MFTKAPKPAVHLIFDHLTPFEMVRDQYQAYGVRFEQAIALAPSNPAFSHHANALVLMPTAGHSSLLLHFAQPIQHISASVIGVRQINLLAFNDRDQVVARHAGSGERSLHHHADLSHPLPRFSLDAIGQGITKVALTSDAPFVVNEIVFTAHRDHNSQPSSDPNCPASRIAPY